MTQCDKAIYLKGHSLKEFIYLRGRYKFNKQLEGVYLEILPPMNFLFKSRTEGRNTKYG